MNIFWPAGQPELIEYVEHLVEELPLPLFLYNAAKNGDLATTRQLHQKVIKISNTVYSVGKYGSSFLKSVKTVLSLMGICNDFVSEPFHRFRTSERDIIQKLLDSLEL